MIRIQLVDDEPAIISALKRVMRDEGWTIDTFSDPQQALHELTQVNYAVIISDLRMPKLDGIAYLQFAKQRQPLSQRLLLSGHGDRDSLMQAINQAQIHRFISKPWDDYELLNAVRSAVSLYQLHEERRQLLEQLKQQKDLVARQQENLLALQRKHPQLLEVTRDADGAIWLNDES